MNSKTPHHLFLLTAILIYIAGLFSGSITLDLHLHDTYLVITLKSLTSFLAISLLVGWLIYVFTIKHLYSKKLSWLHILLTILAVLFFFALPFIADYYEAIEQTPRRYDDLSKLYDAPLPQLPFTVKLILSAVIILILVQLIYIINLTKGIYRPNPGKG
jgi:heme/copper-type cytochrome/quinol oxidase subunit 1